MVESIRVKEYIFPATAFNSVGSQVTVVSTHSINGDVLKILATSNFTGSLCLATSGAIETFSTVLLTSGTATYTPTSFVNTTGSFVVNSPLQITCGSLSSGTGKVFGPVSVFYR